MTTFATRLQTAMDTMNLSKKDLADKIGIYPSRVTGYLNGNYQPKRETLKAIATALCVTPEYLLGETETMDNNIEGLTSQERAIISFYRRSPKRVRDVIDRIIQE